jgi:predicted P-loop ATPase
MLFSRPEHDFVYDVPALEKYLSSAYNLDGLPTSLVVAAYDEYLKHFAYDPVQEYLRSLEWDGFSRLGLVLPGSTGTPMDYELAKKVFVGAAKRVLYPGIEQDFVPVFYGDPGGDMGTWLNLIGVGYTGFFPSPNPNGFTKPEQTWVSVYDINDINDMESQSELWGFYDKAKRTWYVSKGEGNLQHRKWVTWGITHNTYLKDHPLLPGTLHFIEAPEQIDLEKFFDNSQGITNEYRNQVWAEAVHLAS